MINQKAAAMSVINDNVGRPAFQGALYRRINLRR